MSESRCHSANKQPLLNSLITNIFNKETYRNYEAHSGNPRRPQHHVSSFPGQSNFTVSAAIFYGSCVCSLRFRCRFLPFRWFKKKNNTKRRRSSGPGGLFLCVFFVGFLSPVPHLPLCACPGPNCSSCVLGSCSRIHGPLLLVSQHSQPKRSTVKELAQLVPGDNKDARGTSATVCILPLVGSLLVKKSGIDPRRRRSERYAPECCRIQRHPEAISACSALQLT